MNGSFITFEGGEGAGKSTQIRLLGQRLAQTGIEVRETREPGGAPGAEEIRRLLVSGDAGRWDGETEALLHFAARREHLRSTVWPALNAGKWVVCDRFADSTMAYQGYAHGLGAAFINDLYRLVVGDFRPGLTILLDLPVEEGLRRAGLRGGSENRYESLGLEFHSRLRQGFLEIAAAEPERVKVIDARQSIDTVADAVWTEVVRRFNIPV